MSSIERALAALKQGRMVILVDDDRLQRETRGYVNPESFTHGTSAERVQWFERGLRSGRISDCNTLR